MQFFPISHTAEGGLIKAGDINHAIKIDRVVQQGMMRARIIEVWLRYSDVEGAIASGVVEVFDLRHYQWGWKHLIGADE
jgi:hypothetical protein